MPTHEKLKCINIFYVKKPEITTWYILNFDIWFKRYLCKTVKRPPFRTRTNSTKVLWKKNMNIFG